MSPDARLLSGGTRLHLQHGPIDLIIGADGDRARAFAAAADRFETILQGLVAELPTLRAPLGPTPPVLHDPVARRMGHAAHPFHGDGLLTCMVAVAGAVADEVLAAMVAEADLTRAYVNNGGDIALHLGPGQRFTMAMARHDGRDLGRIEIMHTDPVRGIATSGRHGRSLSLGVADSVTVLARTAAQADVAATLIANHVDLPGHPAITRTPARDVACDSDLGTTPVVTHCGPLTARDTETALDAGLAFAHRCTARGLAIGAALFLGDQARATPTPNFQTLQRTPAHA